LAIAPLFGDVASGRAADGSGQATLTLQQADIVTLVVIGLVFAALLGACAYSSRLWSHISGVVVTCVSMTIYSLFIGAAKSRDRFAEDASVSLDAAGLLIAAAVIVATFGLVVALTQARSIPPKATAENVPDGERPARSMTATTGLALAILAIVPVFWFAASAAVLVSSVALTDIRSGSGESGKGYAFAGLILGALIVTVWASLNLVNIVTGGPG
jgi:nicotinamide riboside transporter PnuC